MTANDSVQYIIITGVSGRNSESENTFQTQKLLDNLYCFEYVVYPIMNYKGHRYFLAYKDGNTAEFKKECLQFINNYKQDFAIVKFSGKEHPVKLYKDGTDRLLHPTIFENAAHSFIYNGTTFSFRESKKYHLIKSKDELSNDMIIEYLDNNKQWVERKVENVDSEYEDFYKLMIKYDKVRLAVA